MPNSHPATPVSRYPATLCFLLLAALLLALGPALPAAAKVGKEPPIEERYEQAKAYYEGLKSNSRKAKYRDKWLYGIQKFQDIISTNPEHELAPASLFMAGNMYTDLHRWSGSPLDIGYAISFFEDVVSHYSDHRLADDALMAIGRIYLDKQKKPEEAARTFARLIALYPDGDMAVEAARQLKGLKSVLPSPPVVLDGNAKTPMAVVQDSGEKADLNPIKYWSNNDYTRVVIETSNPVAFKENLLAATSSKPRRLYVDLDNCRIARDYPRTIPIQDGLLKQVRSAQFSSEVVRVVLDTQTFSDYKIFSLSNPFRIVIDVKGERQGSAAPASDDDDDDDEPVRTASLPQQLGLQAKKIIIDPGHGGKDPGAIGPNGLKEKDVVLKVGQRVASRLKGLERCEVIFTRDRDVYVPLEERTALANKQEGHLFISIHANAAPDRSANGVETYVLDIARNKHAMRVAARENATTTKELSDLKNILQSMLQTSFQKESYKLAEYIQDHMVAGLKQKYREVNNLGVKQAPFYVLIGAEMPAVLSEISFISNPVEARRLQDERYLAVVAAHMVQGISRYITDLKLASGYR